MTEVRSFKILYKDQEPIDISVELGDYVTVRVGDWYFKGKVKKLGRNAYLEEFGPMGHDAAPSDKETIYLS